MGLKYLVVIALSLHLSFVVQSDALKCNVCSPDDHKCSHSLPPVYEVDHTWKPSPDGECSDERSEKYCTIARETEYHQISQRTRQMWVKTCTPMKVSGCYSFTIFNTTMTRCALSCQTDNCNTENELKRVKPNNEDHIYCHQCWSKPPKSMKLLIEEVCDVNTKPSLCRTPRCTTVSFKDSFGETSTIKTCSEYEVEDGCYQSRYAKSHSGKRNIAEVCVNSCGTDGCNGQQATGVSLFFVVMGLLFFQGLTRTVY